jgi:hypothetical protein
MFTGLDETSNQNQDPYGMIINASNASYSNRQASIQTKDFMEAFLNSNIAKALKVLVLHQVVIGFDLIGLICLLKPQTLYLQGVFLGPGTEDLHLFLTLSLPETLEQFYLNLDKEVTDDFTFILPRSLKELKAHFGPTKNPHKSPIKFDWAQKFSSLTAM